MENKSNTGGERHKENPCSASIAERRGTVSDTGTNFENTHYPD
jgi:hypothetical protein